MKKSFYSAAAGVLLLVGTGAASAVSLITVSSTGVQGDLYITNFNPLYPDSTRCGGQLCMTMDNLSGTGGLTQANLTIAGTTGNPLDLFDPSLGLEFNPSPGTTTDIVGLQMSWNDATATLSPLEPLTLAFGPGAGNNAGAIGETITINYSGGYSLMGVAFQGQGSLVLTVVNPTTNSNTITFLIADNSTGGTSFTQALNFFDAGTSNLGVIDGPFFVPEPASLALMGIGIAGLGFIRRKKAA